MTLYTQSGQQFLIFQQLESALVARRKNLKGLKSTAGTDKGFHDNTDKVTEARNQGTQHPKCFNIVH